MTTRLDRRGVTLGLIGTGAALIGASALPRPALANGRAQVVIIGGGPGGATVASQLKRAAGGLDVTLIEAHRAYTSCFFSNHCIGGFRSIDSLNHDYSGLGALGVRVVTDRAVAIDTGNKRVRLGSGSEIGYDRLVMSPGIDFKFAAIEGYSPEAAEIMPHAWQGGAQTVLLRRRLEAMEDGGVVVLAAPRMPYRCPPGPYERACFIANYLKSAKPRSKLVLLDPKMSYSKQPVFEEAFAKHYAGIVEVHLTNDIDDYAVIRVTPATGEVVTKAGLTIKAAVANIVPDQRAGDIAAAAGLAKGDWCPIDPASFKSTLAGDVYVLGDAAIANDMPKSAFSANSHGKAVAADILADLGLAERFPARYRNTCWSFVALNDSVKIGANYAPGQGETAGKLVADGNFVSQPGEDAAVRKHNYEESLAWYDTMTADMFAKAQVGSASKAR